MLKFLFKSVHFPIPKQANVEWYEYNKDALEMFANRQQTLALIDSKKLKREPDELQSLKQQQQPKLLLPCVEPMSSSCNNLIGQDQDSDSYILTNFAAADDLSTLERLFYGDAFLKQRKEMNSSRQQQQSGRNCKASEHSTKQSSRNADISSEISSNERFVRLHRAKKVNKESFLNSRYDDQSLSDDEPLFKIGIYMHFH